MNIAELAEQDAVWAETVRRCNDATSHPEQLLKSEAVHANIAAMINDHKA
jgi:hypothetical protein